MPNRPQWLAGARTEPPVSEPSAKSHKPFDTADAEPDDEPPVMRSGAAPVTVAGRPLTELWWAFRYVPGWDAWQSDGALIEQYGLELGADVAARSAFSKAVTRSQFEKASAVRRDFTAHLGRLLGRDGVLVLPTMPDIAPLRAEPIASLETYRNRAAQTLCLTPLSGFPQLNLPLAGRDGAPLGILLLGPAGSDRSLVAPAERIMAHQA